MRPYFRDIHDHLSQIVRITEGLRETLLAAMQMHLALVAVQQNEIVKRLAAWGLSLSRLPLCSASMA